MENINICLAGEYYVASMMHRKGWTASLSLKNYPDIDIFGYNPSKQKHSEIQVKSGQNNYTVLSGLDTSNFNHKVPAINQKYVFVHLMQDSVECFILTNADFINLARRVLQNMNPVTNGKKAPIKFKWKDLAPYKDQWQNLW